MERDRSGGHAVQELKQAGEWNPLWDQLHEWDAEWTEQFMAMRNQAWKSGVLDPLTIEFLAIAVDASTTHLYEPGTRRHIRAALDLGATQEQVLEVLKLVSILGIHSCNMAVPILAEELARRDE